ncbi:MAG: response regulator [Candidatus Bathyarchaeia archaeon]
MNKPPHSTEEVIRIMLIDDDPNQTELTTYNLKRTNRSFDIVNASTPKEALKILREQRIDCVVSDLILPGMSGIQLCKEIKSFLNIPFILYSGRESEDITEDLFSACIDDYVRKEPDLIHYNVLTNKIRAAVSKQSNKIR